MRTCNPWVSGGAEASVDDAVGVGEGGGVGGVAAAAHAEERKPPCSCRPDLSWGPAWQWR